MGAPARLRSAERLVFFTDAVVAIALTLLILPLMESVTEAAEKGLTTAELMTEDAGALVAFLLSFAVIAVFWVLHHRLFEHVRYYSGRLLRMNLAWMLTVVFMPVSTAMTGTMKTDRLQVAVYVGTMALSSGALAVMALTVRRHPELGNPDNPIAQRSVVAPLLMTGLFLLAMVLGVLFPGVSYFFLFLLWLVPVALSRVPAWREVEGDAATGA